MLSASTFRDIVSGRRRGVLAAGLRWLFRAVEVFYKGAVGWRNRRYDSGRAKIHRAGVPVISVGNLTLGGTGKTPMICWLALWFCEKKVRVALVSRGYGAPKGRTNDEALELANKLPGMPHLQTGDRVAAASEAVERFDCRLILLDDGFQHRRLARDLDLVMIDALEPLGFGHVFPRGTLREPLKNLARAHVIVLSRADAVEESQRASIQEQIGHYAPDALWIEVAHAPQSLVSATGERQAVETLRGKRVAAFCGIGSPAGFRHTLEAAGYEVAAFQEFPDHHDYRASDIKSLEAWAESQNESKNVEAVVCTEKDLVKLSTNTLAGLPLWALAIDLEILSGRQELEERLTRFT